MHVQNADSYVVFHTGPYTVWQITQFFCLYRTAIQVV